MSYIYLPKDASQARLREAENAQQEQGRDRKGLFSRKSQLVVNSSNGASSLPLAHMAPIGGLSPFVER